MDCSSPRKCFAPAFSPPPSPSPCAPGECSAPVRGGPLPGRHCNVLLVVRPGDLLLPDDEEIGTFYRHLDPKTSSKRHEEEAANVLRWENVDG
ncbi:unnamed protein product [Closterium sp. NIES-64]|nr:unnamed protein product [Closterium sp. NIES-64]CAI5995079.1 unnamed protein product [Closterium sp. NIES-64]